MPRLLTFIAAVVLNVLLVRSGALATSPQSNDISTFLGRLGFARIHLERHYPNCLSLPVKINQKSGLLLMATACPISALDRNSATKFGLVVRKTTKPVRGSLGTSNEHLGMSELKNLVVANGADLSGVRVAVLNLANLNEWRSRPHVDGVFGYPEMRRLSAVLDCAHQALYINSAGAKRDASAKLGQFLVARGFTRVPMQLDSKRHFEVNCAINGDRLKMTLDTGAVFTCINPQTAASAGVGARLTPLKAGAAGGLRAKFSAGRVKEFSIGNFKILNANLAVLNVADESLGMEELLLNFAVIDVQGMNLYLRHQANTSPDYQSVARPQSATAPIIDPNIPR